MKKKLIKIIFLGLIGLICILSTPTLLAQSPNSQTLLQQGIEAYQNENFVQALTFWQQAESGYQEKGEKLNQGLVLSNLSLAYQHLGQWDKAEANITQALNLIQTLDQSSPNYNEILAKAWNTQGRLFWEQGKDQEALNSWKQATYYYQKVNHIEGALKTQLNQVKVLQGLGLNNQAIELIKSVNQNLDSISDPNLRASILSELGLILKYRGELDRSQQVLQQGLNLATKANIQANILLELGNTQQALANKKLVQGKLEEAHKHTQTALAYYQQAEKLDNTSEQILPLLNQFSLLVHTGQANLAIELIPIINEKITHLSPSRHGIYARLNFAHSLTCFKQTTQNNDFSCISDDRQDEVRSLLKTQPSLNTPSWNTILQTLVTTVEQARQLKDPLVESLSIGQMGELYEIKQQWIEAKKLTENALILLENIQAPDLRYRWEWQLGRLLKQQGDLQGAIASYTAAVNSLKSVRSDLLTVSAEVQFSFRDQVEPVYRELVSLLLNPQENKQISQAELKQAIQQIDALQLAELENFLGCSLQSSDSLNENLELINPKSAFIYSIILPDRFAVILNIKNQPLIYAETTVQKTFVIQTIKKLRKAIVRRNAGEVIEQAQLVYNWLIRPLEKHLNDQQKIENLIFVLDGDLRNIPLGVLYDKANDQYLVEKSYNLSLLTSSRFLNIATKQPQKLAVLAAGISEELEVGEREFVALNITQELNQIKSILPTKIFLNGQFNQNNIHNNIQDNNYPIVHLATHGNFSSDPLETFILAYSNQGTNGELLRPNDLSYLLSSSNKDRPYVIDLLVLSACQTALGDNRATLGLAGLALRSGAKATLATLWQISDESTVKLMEAFYQNLSQPGMTKAKALHLAQQTLLKERRFQNPYYWASYILVGGDT